MFRASLCPLSRAYQLQQQQPLIYRRNLVVAVLLVVAYQLQQQQQPLIYRRNLVVAVLLVVAYQLQQQQPLIYRRNLVVAVLLVVASPASIISTATTTLLR